MRRESPLLTCPNGHTFKTQVHRTANVTQSPDLRDEIVAGGFNRVRCPECGAELYADVPFLYHDMDTAMRVWVYPEGSRADEEAILGRIRQAASIANTVLPTDRSGPELVFGLDELRALIAER